MNKKQHTPTLGCAPTGPCISEDQSAWLRPDAERNSVALSIITVNYNSASLLTKTLPELKPFAENASIELVLVDGGSSDESKSVIGEYRRFIAQLVSERDNGIFDAMNKGINLCRGEWIWFVNAGDIPAVTPDEAMETIMRAQTASANYIYSDLLIGTQRLRQQLDLPFLALRTINHQNTIYRRQLLLGGYDSSYRFCADYSHLLNVYRDLRPLKSVSPLCIYDCNGVSSASSRSRRISIWKERLRAQIESPLNMVPKTIFACISVLAILGKMIHPSIGRTTIRQ